MNIIRLILLPVILVVAFFLWRWVITPGPSVLSQKDQQKTLEKMLGRPPVTTAAVTPTVWTDHNLGLVSFQYPSWAKISRSDSKTVFSFHLPGERLVGTVQVISGDLTSVNEFPAVSLRSGQPDVYRRDVIKIGSLTGVKYSKGDPDAEQTAFFRYRGHTISFAVSGSSKEKVDTFFSTLIRSASFQ